MTNILSNIKLYDVTLRDCLQSLKKSMSLDEKNKISHRSIAVGKLVNFLNLRYGL